MCEGEDPSPAADSASIRRQVREKFHQLAATQANLAHLTLGRRSGVSPCHTRGGRAKKLPCRDQILARARSFRAREAQGHDCPSCAHDGTTRQFTRWEGR